MEKAEQLQAVPSPARPPPHHSSVLPPSATVEQSDDGPAAFFSSGSARPAVCRALSPERAAARSPAHIAAPRPLIAPAAAPLWTVDLAVRHGLGRRRRDPPQRHGQRGLRRRACVAAPPRGARAAAGERAGRAWPAADSRGRASAGDECCVRVVGRRPLGRWCAFIYLWMAGRARSVERGDGNAALLCLATDHARALRSAWAARVGLG